MANSWLQSNIAKSQRAVQAREAASQARKRAADTLTAGFQTAQAGFQPMAETQMDIYKQKELFGPEGTMRDYQKDIMGTEAKHASEKEMRMYEQLTGQKAIGEDGELTKNFIQWKHGYDPELQWAKHWLQDYDVRGPVTELDKWMDTAKAKFVTEGGGQALKLNPTTGVMEGFTPEIREKMIENLAGQLMRADKRMLSQYGIKSREVARQQVTEYVDSLIFAEEEKLQDAGTYKPKGKNPREKNDALNARFKGWKLSPQAKLEQQFYQSSENVAKALALEYLADQLGKFNQQSMEKRTVFYNHLDTIDRKLDKLSRDYNYSDASHAAKWMTDEGNAIIQWMKTQGWTVPFGTMEGAYNYYFEEG